MCVHQYTILLHTNNICFIDLKKKKPMMMMQAHDMW